MKIYIYSIFILKPDITNVLKFLSDTNNTSFFDKCKFKEDRFEDIKGVISIVIYQRTDITIAK